VHYRDLSPAPRTFRRPAASAVAVQRARQVNAAPGAQWRPEREAARIPRAPGHDERSHADRIPNDRSPVEGSEVERIPGSRRPIDLAQVGRIAGERGYVEPAAGNRIAGNRSSGERAPGNRVPANRIPGDRIPGDHNPGNRSLIDRGHVERVPSERIARDRIPGTRSPIDRSHVERVPSDHGYADRNDIDRKIERSRIRLEPEWRSAPRKSGLERGVVLVSAGLIVGAAGCFWLLYNVFGAALSVAPSQAVLQAPSTESYTPAVVVRSGKSDSLARSAHPMMQQLGEADAIKAIDRVALAPAPDAKPARPANNSSGPRVAQSSSYFAPVPDRTRGKDPVKDTISKQPMRLAALEYPAPRSGSAFDPVIPRIPPDGDPKTTLVDFHTAPFPYDGRMPGSNRQFLDAGEGVHRGHTNFRGRTLWERDTYSDPRVLLHIPPGFDANKPSVMIVFFHGHGAILGRDVRDRQKVPAQISASGVNAVLVAPQFAVDAADSSPGKFGDPGGFKRFLDEAAGELARLHGDPRTRQTFANMPIVIVAYSGGFGPTLSVLDNGGVKPRIRGIVLLDALYSGINKFANWIAENRSGFFVSSYTPHTRGHNADLEGMLKAKSVPYGSELRHDHLAGSVTFLPAGPISHRDFVTHAWADLPLKDILLRLDEYDTRVQTASTRPGSNPLASAATARSN
jgi:hypothetical protein